MLKTAIVSALPILLLMLFPRGDALAANFTRTISAKLSAAEAENVELARLGGKIQLSQSPDGELRISAKVMAEGKDLGVRAKISGFRFEKSVREGVTLLDLVPFPGLSSDTYKLDISLMIPSGLILTMDAPGSDITAKSVKIGKGLIRAGDGGVALTNCVFGSISVQAEGGILARNCKGTVNLWSEAGTITASDHFGPISAMSTHGDIKITGGLGNRSAVCEWGSIEITAGKPATQDEIELHIYDSIQVNTFGASVKLSLPAGDFTVDAFSVSGGIRWRIAPGLNARTLDSGTRILGQGYAAIKIESETGDISISAGYS